MGNTSGEKIRCDCGLALTIAAGHVLAVIEDHWPTEATESLLLIDLRATDTSLAKFWQGHTFFVKTLCAESTYVNLQNVDDFHAGEVYLPFPHFL